MKNFEISLLTGKKISFIRRVDVMLSSSIMTYKAACIKVQKLFRVQQTSIILT